VFLGGGMGMWMMLECIGSQEMGWEKVDTQEKKQREGLGRGLGKYLIFFSEEKKSLYLLKIENHVATFPYWFWFGNNFLNV
jgi:hypothetical protein